LIRHPEAARITDDDASKFWPGARLAIRQAALDGKVQIYGHKSEETGNHNGTSWSLVSTEVPQGYWEFADITEVATSTEYANELSIILDRIGYQMVDLRRKRFLTMQN
jgi:hypothetical protein